MTAQEFKKQYRQLLRSYHAGEITWMEFEAGLQDLQQDRYSDDSSAENRSSASHSRILSKPIPDLESTLAVDPPSETESSASSAVSGSPFFPMVLAIACLVAALVGGVIAVNRTEPSKVMPVDNTDSALDDIPCWAHLAADGDVDARRRLGEAYFHGRGGKADYKKAIDFFRLAARQGDVTSLYYLGRCHELGLGLPKNVEQAVTLYREAKLKGSDAAEKALDRLAPHEPHEPGPVVPTVGDTVPGS